LETLRCKVDVVHMGHACRTEPVAKWYSGQRRLETENVILLVAPVTQQHLGGLVGQVAHLAREIFRRTSQFWKCASINAREMARSQIPDVGLVLGTAAPLNLSGASRGEAEQSQNEWSGWQFQLGMWLILSHEDIVTGLELKMLGAIGPAPGVGVAQGVPVLRHCQVVGECGHHVLEVGGLMLQGGKPVLTCGVKDRQRSC